MREIADKPDVSIVVTVHNAERYLEECLHSACRQTYQNIEIICMDGGSTDSSPDILEKFARDDPRIRIINDPNTSYGHKLNVGFEAAKGSYVGILESDDRLCFDMIENLYRVACRYEPDVIGGNMSKSFKYRGHDVEYEIQTYPDISYYDRLIVKNREPVRYAHGRIWTCLYKKAFLKEKNIKINETAGAAYQDQGFSFLTDILAETAYYINRAVYQYRVDNPDSSVYDDGKVFEIAWEMQFIENELKCRNILDAGIWEEFWRHKYTAYISNMARLSEKSKSLFKHRFRAELRNDVSKVFFKMDLFNENIKEILVGFLDDDEYFEKNVTRTADKMEEKLCALLDRVLNKQIVIFGAGRKGKRLYCILEEICAYMKDGHTEIVCFCDNSTDLRGVSIEGKKVFSVEYSIKYFPDAFYIVANAEHYEGMLKQLRDYGIREEKIGLFS